MVNNQLSIFNVPTVVATSYKVGDRVKLRKKPVAASYVKKGDIVEVSAVHPLNGSIKFWNERSERWEFVHPEEIARVVDSPTPAKVPGEEIPHSETLTTTQIDAVGESKALSDDDYLALNAISTYQPRGTARGGKYFRLSYKDGGGKVRTVHIRGGNTDSPIAQAKVQEVQSLLAAGLSPAQIAAMLQKLH